MVIVDAAVDLALLGGRWSYPRRESFGGLD